MSNYLQHRQELSKNGRLGVVWMAGNMSADSCRTKLTRRDYSRVNVVEVCQVFVNLENTFSLRLSSILMLGVVRVFEQQTNFLYIVSKNISKRLKLSAEREISSSTQKDDAITIPDRLNQTLDVINTNTFSCFSPHTEGKFFSVDYTSPVSSSTNQVTNSSQLDFSSHMADPKDITIEDCIPSLNSTFIEEDDNFGDPDVPTLGLVMVHNGTVTPVARSSQPQYEASQDPSAGGISPMVFDAACDQVMLFDPESGEMRPHSEGAQSCTSTPYSTPYSTHARRHDNSTPIASFVTPYKDSTSNPQRVMKETRRSKRKLMFDVKTILSNETLLRNLKTGQTTLKRRAPVEKHQSAKELLTLPVEPAIARNSKLFDIFKRNAKEQTFDWLTPKDFEFNLESPTATNSNNNNSIEVAMRAQSMSTSDVEMLRGGSRLSNYYDSNNATWDQAPAISDVSGEAASMNDTSSSKRRPSLSSTNNRPNNGGSLPIILEGLSLIEDVTGFDGDPGILMPPQLDDSVRQSLFPDAAAPTLREATVILSRQLVEKMDNRDEMDYSELLPSRGQCSRQTAARTFNQTLELLSKGVVKAEQKEPYGEITLQKGPNY